MGGALPRRMYPPVLATLEKGKGADIRHANFDSHTDASPNGGFADASPGGRDVPLFLLCLCK